MRKTQLKEQRVDKLEKLFEELSSKPAGIPLEKGTDDYDWWRS